MVTPYYNTYQKITFTESNGSSTIISKSFWHHMGQFLDI